MAPELDDLNNKAAAAGVNMTELCRVAGVARSTPQRWINSEFGPSLRTINKLRDALREIIADRARKMKKAGL